MLCRKCGFETRIVDSRAAGPNKRRRRECTNCKERFSTYEIREDDLARVKKAVASVFP